MPRLPLILLVDDSEMDTYIHLRRLNKLKLAEEVMTCGDGRQAIDYLTTPGADGAYPQPAFLFLDINMPIMDGWEFLDHYGTLPPDRRAGVVVALLTSVAGTADAERAYTYPVIDAYETKPLDKKKLSNLMQRFFPDIPSVS